MGISSPRIVAIKLRSPSGGLHAGAVGRVFDVVASGADRFAQGVGVFETLLAARALTLLDERRDFIRDRLGFGLPRGQAQAQDAIKVEERRLPDARRLVALDQIPSHRQSARHVEIVADLVAETGREIGIRLGRSPHW